MGKRTRSKKLGIAFLFSVLFAFSGLEIGSAAPVRLNNLVTELAHLTRVPEELSFNNLREGWVFFSATADVKPHGVLTFTLDKQIPVIQVGPGEKKTVEGMRYLPKGTHTLHVKKRGDTHIDSITIRAIPELHYCRFPANPAIKEYGPYDWKFLQKYILPQVNTIIGRPNGEISSRIDEWRDQGGKWISYGGLPHDPDLTPDKAYKYWADNPGFQDPRLSGLIADEFQGRQNPFYPSWIEGLRRLASDPRFVGKRFYGYCGGPGMYSRPQTRELVRTVFKAGYYMAWERYHHEMPTLEEAKEFMDSLLGKEITKWRATFPDCQKQMILVLGMFNAGFGLNVRPDVDYKVWIDMQMQYLATRPGFDGLFGVQFWTSSYADEETLRWVGQLYRHYGIEGRTDLLSSQFGYTYSLNHIINPDFFDGLKGWNIEAAAKDSVRTDYMERYARLEGRYWHRGGFPDQPAGNTFLWTRRCANRPNRVSQPIRNLIPGKLYSIKMITADYGDITNGRSVKKRHAVSFIIDGGEALPEKSFQAFSNSRTSMVLSGPFKSGDPAWFNYHRVVFRATKKTGQLTISDWAAPDNLGGPLGQELMINFIELQPYFSETES